MSHMLTVTQIFGGFLGFELQRATLDLLTVLRLTGNDDADGLTAKLPGGHLAGCHGG